MSCLLISGNKVKCCGAFKDVFVLSPEELENTCGPTTWASCPRYKRWKDNGCNEIPLTVEDLS